MRRVVLCREEGNRFHGRGVMALYHGSDGNSQSMTLDPDWHEGGVEAWRWDKAGFGKMLGVWVRSAIL
jgi:hypothetical protein